MSDTTNNNIKQLIKDYIKIDDQLSIINKESKEIRKAKTDLEDSIKDFMVENNIAKVDIGSGCLRISKTKSHKKINKKIILEVLLDTLEENKATEIIDELFNEDDLDEITKLERSKKK